MTLLHPAAGVSVLFTRSDSCYVDLGADCWDINRDARCYTGPGAVVAHPPCRGWGRLRHWAKPRPDEKALALFAVDCVRKFGGVLEHPYGSTLWPAAGLPKPGHAPDAWGGWTLLVEQGWWGHPAPKPTYLYIVGVERKQIGELPALLHRPGGRTQDLSPADRERTPVEFAKFLLSIAALSSISADVVNGPQKNAPAILERQICSSIKQNDLLHPAADTVTPAGRVTSTRRRRGSYIDLDNVLIG